MATYRFFKDGIDYILLVQTSKTDNNALDIDAIYNLKLRKTVNRQLYYQIKRKFSMASHYAKTT
jgi:hypothetical protein